MQCNLATIIAQNKSEIRSMGCKTWTQETFNYVWDHLQNHREFTHSITLEAAYKWRHVIKAIVAHLEHNETGIAKQVELLKTLDLKYSNQSASVTTNTSNVAQDDIYAPMPNIANQSYAKMELSDNDQYRLAQGLLERLYTSVYAIARIYHNKLNESPQIDVFKFNDIDFYYRIIKHKDKFYLCVDDLDKVACFPNGFTYSDGYFEYLDSNGIWQSIDLEDPYLEIEKPIPGYRNKITDMLALSLRNK